MKAPKAYCHSCKREWPLNRVLPDNPSGDICDRLRDAAAEEGFNLLYDAADAIDDLRRRVSALSSQTRGTEA